MDERKELARQLRKMSFFSGDMDCTRCSYERRCAICGHNGHGCAVLKRAADLLAPSVNITEPILLEELREAAAERPVLVYVICMDENGKLYDPECGEWEMFFSDKFIADGTFDTTDNYGRTFVAFWDEPGRCDHET